MEELKSILDRAGFTGLSIIDKHNSDEIIRSWKFGEGVETMVVSAYVTATKPAF